MRASTKFKTLMVILSIMQLPACGGRDDAEPLGADTGSLDSSGDGAAVPGDTGGADTADGTDIADIDDVVTAIDVPEDAAWEDAAGDTTSSDVPDTAGSFDVPDTAVPLTPFEECAVAEDCTAVPLVSVCDTADPERTVYPNDCYFFCQKKADCLAGITDGDTAPCDKSYQGDPGSFLDDLAPTTSASCKPPCPAEYGCTILDTEKQPVCLDGETQYPNPYVLCCDTGKTVFDPGVTPGKCCNCEPPSAATFVCGKDGQTYGNKCILVCQGEILAYEGPCVPG